MNSLTILVWSLGFVLQANQNRGNLIPVEIWVGGENVSFLFIKYNRRYADMMQGEYDDESDEDKLID